MDGVVQVNIVQLGSLLRGLTWPKSRGRQAAFRRGSGAEPSSLLFVVELRSCFLAVNQGYP